LNADSYKDFAPTELRLGPLKVFAFRSKRSPIDLYKPHIISHLQRLPISQRFLTDSSNLLPGRHVNSGTGTLNLGSGKPILRVPSLTFRKVCL
jgi:hypothetical protein